MFWTLPVLPPTLREAALAYASHGIPVFPCAPSAKTPLTETGLHEATTNAARIRSWWRWQPEANIGMPTGTVFDVLDVDLHPDRSGYPALHELIEAGLAHGWSHLVTTPSGGLHVYFPADPDSATRNWSRRDARIDFRGTGGYVIAPPSQIMIAGTPHRYTLAATGPAPRPVDGARIKEFLTPPAPPVTAVRNGPAVSLSARAKRLGDWLAAQPKGNRHPGLFWAACRLTDAGATEADIIDALEPAAQSIGIETSEIHRTIRNAHREASLNPTPANDSTPVSRALPVTR